MSKQMLEPCPFCGEKPVIGLSGSIISCGNQECAIHVEAFENAAEDAVRAWNTRALRSSADSATSPIGQADVQMLKHLADSMGFGRTHDMLRRVIAACPYLTLPARTEPQAAPTLSIDDVPSCGQENDYRRAKSQAAPPREEMPEIPDDDTDFTPDLARKIIAKYRSIIATRASASQDCPIGSSDPTVCSAGCCIRCSDWRDGFNAARSQADSSPQAASIDAEVAVQLVEALNDMEISAYNAAKYRIGRALRLLTSNASSQAVNVDLGRLIDWVYLYATEGSGWPDTKTVKDPLIALATKREPTQEDADCLKACGTLKQLLALSRPERNQSPNQER